MVPTDDRGVDEALNQVRLLVGKLAAGLDQGGVGVEAMIRQQNDPRLELGRFLDRKRLRSDVALHRAQLVGEKRLRVECVGLDLFLAEPVFELQPLKIACDPFLGHEQRQRFEVFQLGDLGFRMGQENLRILLEYGGDRHHRHVIGDRIERHQRVRGHEEVELSGDQQNAIIVVGAARHDSDVEPVILVGAVGQGLEKSAVLGLGDPVGSKRDLVQRGLGARRQNGHKNGHQACG